MIFEAKTMAQRRRGDQGSQLSEQLQADASHEDLAAS